MEDSRLAGRTVLITGASSGLGFASAAALAKRGAHVVLATRNRPRTDGVMRRIAEAVPDASLEHLPLELSSLASVREAATTFLERHDRLDVLMNNAGIMGGPYARTADGFESHFGTNHLGHFALTGRLLPQLLATPSSRVVIVSSLTHKRGRLDREDLMWERRRYNRWGAYAQSKVAGLLFLRELDRRLRAAGAGTTAVGAHPGVTATDNQATAREGQGRIRRRLGDVAAGLFIAVVGQPLEIAALPQVYAAVEDVAGGSYWGPARWGELKGLPGPAVPSRRARDDDDAAWLWARSVELTGVPYEELHDVSRQS